MATEFTLVTANYIKFCWFTYKMWPWRWRAVNDPITINAKKTEKAEKLANKYIFFSDEFLKIL